MKVKIYKATNKQTGEVVKETIDNISKFLGVSKTALYCDVGKDWLACGCWKIESTDESIDDKRDTRQNKLYRIVSVKTGETFTGGSVMLSEKLEITRTTFYNGYSHKRLIHNEWKIEKVGSIEKEPYHDWSYLETQHENNIDRDMVGALYKAFTSGRSDYWTVQHIADECGVSTQFIKKVLEESH